MGRSIHHDRRQFLACSSAAAAVIAAHGSVWAQETQPDSHAGPSPNKSLILSLQLLAAVPAATMKDFYVKLLGMHLVDEQPGRVTIQAGRTLVTFVESPVNMGQPFYHFAFNIPENKVLAALAWQKERTALIPVPPRLRQAKHPDEVVNYSHWNAHSIFFFDPAGNVVEYIARHDLKNSADGPFTSKDILYASEIGLIVDDVPAAAASLKQAVGIDEYRGASEVFTALGDEHGLLLVMKRGRILSLDAPKKKAAAVFRTAVLVCGRRPAMWEPPGFPYELTVSDRGEKGRKGDKSQ